MERDEKSNQTVKLNRIVVPSHLRIVPLDAEGNLVESGAGQTADAFEAIVEDTASVENPALAEALGGPETPGEDAAPKAWRPRPRRKPPVEEDAQALPHAAAATLSAPQVSQEFDPVTTAEPEEPANSNLKTLGYSAAALAAVIGVLLFVQLRPGAEQVADAPAGDAGIETLPLENVQPTSSAAVATVAPSVPELAAPEPVASIVPASLADVELSTVSVSPVPSPRPVTPPVAVVEPDAVAPPGPEVAPVAALAPAPAPRASADVLALAVLPVPQSAPSIPLVVISPTTTPVPPATVLAPAPEHQVVLATAPLPLALRLPDASEEVRPEPVIEAAPVSVPLKLSGATALVNQVAVGTLNALRSPTGDRTTAAEDTLLGFVRSLQPNRRSEDEIATMLQRAADAGTLQIPPSFLRPDGRIDTTAILQAMTQQ